MCYDRRIIHQIHVIVFSSNNDSSDLSLRDNGLDSLLTNEIFMIFELIDVLCLHVSSHKAVWLF